MKIQTTSAIFAIASLCALASSATAAGTATYIGQDWSADNYYGMQNKYVWQDSVTPYGKFKQEDAMDVIFSGELLAEGRSAKSLGTWAESEQAVAENWASQHFNSITIKKGGISWMGIALGAQFSATGKGADAYAGMIVHNDVTVDDISTMIVGGGVKTNGNTGLGYTTVHSTVEINGNFVYGYNNTAENGNGYNFRFGGNGGYNTAYGGKTVDSVNQALDSVVIGKDLRLGSGHSVILNVGTNAYDNGYDADNPDVLIKGRVVGYDGIDSDGNLNQNGFALWGKNQSYFQLMGLSKENADNGRTSVISVNGISGYIITGNDVEKYTSKNYLSVLKLTNDASTKVTSAYLADEIAIKFGTTSKVKVIMDGEGEQRFYKAFNISGGIEVNKGKLLIMSTTQGTNGHSWDLANETEAKSHGDLVMNGGTFGFYLADSLKDDYKGGFTLTNLEYNGGTIQLCVYENYVDSLDVSDTITASDTMNFNFVAESASDLEYLLDSRRIISWKEVQDVADFAANIITINGKTYKAVFTKNSDGLYVKYVSAIPEPATCALLFGGLALAFAAWRKKRQ